MLINNLTMVHCTRKHYILSRHGKF